MSHSIILRLSVLILLMGVSLENHYINTVQNEDFHESVFTDIYKNKVWGYNAQGEGFSGGGSLVKHCLSYIQLVQDFIKAHKIQTVVDAGCGDWEFSRYMNWSGIEYTGYDIVKHIVDKVSNKYAARNIHFYHANFLTTELPAADLLLCKHVLQHLSNQDILSFLPQLKKFKYCIITNEVYPSSLSSNNPDILPGGGRKVDLTQPPFSIQGTPLCVYYIGSTAHQMLLIDNTQAKP